VIRYLAANYSVREAAKALNLTPNTIYRWFQQDQTMMSRLKALNEHLAEELNGQVFQAQLNFKQRLTQAADDALNEMESLMWTSSSEGIRLKAAQDLLDRDGRAPRTAKTEGRQINVNIDADMVKLAMQAAAEDSARGR
jgi:DNA-binding CsgD family transcriptional regulator